jgi:L-alanine-DL-glutamate epimerase-like enolase superfamily enzyme
VLVVCQAGLGTLNHTALTLEALENKGVPCAGLVIGSWPTTPGAAEEFNRGALDDLAPVRAVLAAGAADMIMIDPTWVGGISGTRRIAELAQVYNVPTLMHDCTGPMTLLSGLHIASSNTGVAYQETVRAHLATLYPHLIDVEIRVDQGHLGLPDRPGIGARWKEDLFDPNHPGHRITRL